MRELITTCDGCGRKSKKKHEPRDYWRRHQRAQNASINFPNKDLCATCKRGAANAARKFLKGRRHVHKKS